MRKRLLVLSAAAVVAGVLLFNKQPGGTDPAESQAMADKGATVLRFGHNLPVDSAMHQAALKYADRVKARSKGRLVISVHPSQELGNDHQMVEMARAGELDILLTPTAKMSVPIPAMQFADIPFLFPSREDAYAVLDGEPGRMLLAKLDDIDLVGVAFWENGFKHFTANRRLSRPEDFQGLRMRVMKSRIIMEQFKALGAIPIAIDFHATRKALADGVVDGQENPLVAIVSMGFHQVQSHMLLSNHAYLGYVLSISAKSLNKLPGDLQVLLLEAAREVTPWQRQETRRREEGFIAAIRGAGVEITELAPDQRRRFAERTHFIAEDFKLIIGTDIMKQAERIIRDRHLPQSQAR